MSNSLIIFPVGGGSSGGAVLSGVLTSGSVTSGFIGNNAVVSGSIASGSIAPPHIASGYKLIASGQVQGFFGTERDIASGTVGVFDFGSGAVIAGTVGSGAIVSGNIGSGQVGQFAISSGAVTSGRLGVTGSPTGTNFLRDDFTWAATSTGSGSVTSGAIASGAVISGTIGSGAVQGFFGSIRNIASGTVGVFDFGSGAVVAGTVGSGAIVSGNIASGQVGQFAISSGAVTSGRLGVTGAPTGTNFLRDDFTWATATSTPDGNASVGAIRTVSGSYIAVSGDYTILSNVSGASGSITVPAAPLAFSGSINQGRIFNIKKIDPSPNAVSVVGASGEAIDGATSVALTTQFQSIQIQTDGTSYWIL
jgi:hypothetical protein